MKERRKKRDGDDEGMKQSRREKNRGAARLRKEETPAPAHVSGVPVETEDHYVQFVPAAQRNAESPPPPPSNDPKSPAPMSPVIMMGSAVPVPVSPAPSAPIPEEAQPAGSGRNGPQIKELNRHRAADVMASRRAAKSQKRSRMRMDQSSKKIKRR